MLRRIRHSRFLRILWGFMGIYFLNISIDSADLTTQGVSEDLNINDQESILEFFVEKVLGCEDAFVEYDDHDLENIQTQSKIKLDWITQVIERMNSYPFDNHDTTSNEFGSNFDLSEGFQKLISPPPEC